MSDPALLAFPPTSVPGEGTSPGVPCPPCLARRACLRYAAAGRGGGGRPLSQPLRRLKRRSATRGGAPVADTTAAVRWARRVCGAEGGVVSGAWCERRCGERPGVTRLGGGCGALGGGGQGVGTCPCSCIAGSVGGARLLYTCAAAAVVLILSPGLSYMHLRGWPCPRPCLGAAHAATLRGWPTCHSTSTSVVTPASAWHPCASPAAAAALFASPPMAHPRIVPPTRTSPPLGCSQPFSVSPDPLSKQTCGLLHCSLTTSS